MTGFRSYPGLPQIGMAESIASLGRLFRGVPYFDNGADIERQTQGVPVLGLGGGAHQFGHGVTDAMDTGTDPVGQGDQIRE